MRPWPERFLYLGPAVVDPLLDGLVVPLCRFAGRPLSAPAHPAEHLPDVSGVVLHSGGLLDHLGRHGPGSTDRSHTYSPLDPSAGPVPPWPGRRRSPCEDDQAGRCVSRPASPRSSTACASRRPSGGRPRAPGRCRPRSPFWRTGRQPACEWPPWPRDRGVDGLAVVPCSCSLHQLLTWK